MKTYELLYIVSSKYTDAEVGGIQKNVEAMAVKFEGKMTRQENLGKIKLAYPIQGMRHGTYILVHVELEPENLGKFEREIRLSDEVLRHQVVVLPEGAKDRKYQISSYVAPLSEEAREQKKESRTDAPAREPKAAPVQAAPPVPAKLDETSPSMSMEELDEKLDKILEADVT